MNATDTLFDLPAFEALPAPQPVSASWRLALLILIATLTVVSSTKIWKTQDDEPPMLPYRIPLLGHTIAFLNNSEALITYARERLRNTRSPFSLLLGSKTFHIITDPHDVSSVYKNTSTLSFDMFLRKIMGEFGSKESAIDRILHVPRARNDQVPGKSVVELAHDLQLRQTSRQDLTEIGKHITEWFQSNILTAYTQWPSGSQGFAVKPKEKAAISLKAWTEQTFIRAGQDAYFGPKLAELSPDLPLDLIRLDELSWQVFYQYPRMFRQECEKLSAKIRATLLQYFRLPKDERPATAWFTQALEDEYRRVGLSTEDIASQMLFLYWGINTNISKMGYWMIAHAVFNPQLIDMIREETTIAFQSDGSLDGDYISNAANCPRLHSFWLECLRLASSSTALRYVTEDTVVGGKILRKGNAILMSARQLHFNTAPTAFGESAANFDPERFFKNKKLERNPSFRPFGGGKTLCPGRHLAKHMALTFVALVFRRFDVTLATDQPFPACEESKPAIGIISGKDDVLIHLAERRTGI